MVVKLEAEVTLRCVELGTLISRGLEQAAVANDACGSPLPAAALEPRLAFDGRLLQSKLLQAQAPVWLPLIPGPSLPPHAGA